jgi:hypothetical protein
VQTGAHDILALIDRRWVRWGIKVGMMHRQAPRLDSILPAGHPATLR